MIIVLNGDPLMYSAIKAVLREIITDEGLKFIESPVSRTEKIVFEKLSHELGYDPAFVRVKVDKRSKKLKFEVLDVEYLDWEPYIRFRKKYDIKDEELKKALYKIAFGKGIPLLEKKGGEGVRSVGRFRWGV